MSKHRQRLKVIATADLLAMGSMHMINQMVSASAVLKNILKPGVGSYYHWKTGDVFFRAEGNGAPLLLIHDLTTASSSYEWSELEEKLNCKFDHNFCLELRRLQNKGMQREVFLDTARQTAENAPRNPAGYFRTLLQNCERDGILTAEDMQKRAKPAPAQPAIGPSSEQLSAFDREWYERVKRYTREKAVPS